MITNYSIQITNSETDALTVDKFYDVYFDNGEYIIDNYGNKLYINN